MNALRSYADDFKTWFNDMGTLDRTVQIWASLFPLPQFVLGLWGAAWVGPDSLSAWYLYCRIESFLVAPLVHRRRPFHKLMGPIMHAPFYVLVPIAWGWLFSSRGQPMAVRQDRDVTLTTKFHYYYVLYTTIITTVSLVSDTNMLIKKYVRGMDVGEYPREVKDRSSVKSQ